MKRFIRKIFMVLIAAIALTGCSEHYTDAERVKQRGETERARIEAETRRIIAGVESRAAKERQENRLVFLILVAMIAAIAFTINYIVRLCKLASVRKAEIKADFDMQAKRSELALRLMFENIDKFSEEERKQLFSKGGLLDAPKPPLLTQQ